MTIVTCDCPDIFQIDTGTFHSVITKGTYNIDGITEDPKDDMFIACALEGKVDYLVSRDPQLRNLKHYIGVYTYLITAKS